jgi:hypothetical protein
MTSTKSVKSVRPKKKSQPELTEEEQRELLERANQIREQRAQTQLDLAKLFLEKQKPDIALRRLKEIAAEYGGSPAATAAKKLIKTL